MKEKERAERTREIADMCRRLASLLDDPQPGLHTWNQATARLIAELRPALGDEMGNLCDALAHVLARWVNTQGIIADRMALTDTDDPKWERYSLHSGVLAGCTGQIREVLDQFGLHISEQDLSEIMIAHADEWDPTGEHRRRAERVQKLDQERQRGRTGREALRLANQLRTSNPDGGDEQG